MLSHSRISVSVALFVNILRVIKTVISDITCRQNYTLFSNTMCCLFLLSVGGDFVRIRPLSNNIPLGCVHTWSPSIGSCTSVQNRVTFRHWILQVFKYHLVPEYKVETLCSGSGTVTFPIFWCKYKKRKNGVFALVPNGNRERAPSSSVSVALDATIDSLVPTIISGKRALSWASLVSHVTTTADVSLRLSKGLRRPGWGFIDLTIGYLTAEIWDLQNVLIPECGLKF